MKVSRAVFSAVVVVAVGYGAIRAAEYYLHLSQPTGIILILSFLLALGVFTGKIQELSAPGGWGAKFAAQARAPVDPAQSPIDLSTAEMEEIPKLTLPEVASRINLVRDGRPLVLTLTVGKGDYYRLHAISSAIQALAQFRNFKLVIFRDMEGRFVASAPSWLLRAALDRNDESANRLVAAVNSGAKDEVATFPGMLTECVTTKSSNADALAVMERSNLEAVVVVDDATRQVRGVIERDRILAKMMLALTPAREKSAS